MFLVIPLVEFLHVLSVDINVHHENTATFLCHVSISSVKCSRHRFASSRWHPVLTPGSQEIHETPTGEPSWPTFPRFRGCRARSSVSSRHTAMKFERNQPRSQPIV